MLDPGEQRLVMFTRSFHRRARRLIAGEPTAGLAEYEPRTVLDALTRLNATGMTVPFVSHRLSEVTELCDRVTMLRDDRISAVVAGDEVTEQRLVKEMKGKGQAIPSPTSCLRGLSLLSTSRCDAITALRWPSARLPIVRWPSAFHRFSSKAKLLRLRRGQNPPATTRPGARRATFWRTPVGLQAA